MLCVSEAIPTFYLHVVYFAVVAHHSGVNRYIVSEARRFWASGTAHHITSCIVLRGDRHSHGNSVAFAAQSLLWFLVDKKDDIHWVHPGNLLHIRKHQQYSVIWRHYLSIWTFTKILNASRSDNRQHVSDLIFVGLHSWYMRQYLIQHRMAWRITVTPSSIHLGDDFGLNSTKMSNITSGILNPDTPLAFLPPDIAGQLEIYRYVVVATLGVRILPFLLWAL